MVETSAFHFRASIHHHNKKARAALRCPVRCQSFRDDRGRDLAEAEVHVVIDIDAGSGAAFFATHWRTGERRFGSNSRPTARLSAHSTRITETNQPSERAGGGSSQQPAKKTGGTMP